MVTEKESRKRLQRWILVVISVLFVVPALIFLRLKLELSDWLAQSYLRRKSLGHPAILSRTPEMDGAYPSRAFLHEWIREATGQEVPSFMPRAVLQRTWRHRDIPGVLYRVSLETAYAAIDDPIEGAYYTPFERLIPNAYFLFSTNSSQKWITHLMTKRSAAGIYSGEEMPKEMSTGYTTIWELHQVHVAIPDGDHSFVWHVLPFEDQRLTGQMAMSGQWLVLHDPTLSKSAAPRSINTIVGRYEHESEALSAADEFTHSYHIATCVAQLAGSHSLH